MTKASAVRRQRGSVLVQDPRRIRKLRSCPWRPTMHSTSTADVENTAFIRLEVNDNCSESVRRLIIIAVGNSSDPEEKIKILTNYMRPWWWMPRKEHRAKFLSLLEGFTTGQTSGGDRRGELKLVISPVYSHSVCANAFAKAHCRGHTYYDKVVYHYVSTICVL